MVAEANLPLSVLTVIFAVPTFSAVTPKERACVAQVIDTLLEK